MEEKPDTLKDKPLKEQFVPFEERESQSPKMTAFLYDMAKLIIVAKISAIAGGIIGQVMSDRKLSTAWSNIRKFRFSDKAILGKAIGGTAGAVYEMHHHWKKEEANRLGAKEINGNIRDVVELEHIKRETEKEDAFIADLRKLETAMSKPEINHAERVTSRREETAVQAEKGAQI